MTLPATDVRAEAFSHVYILVHRTEHLVKIGKANDIISRASGLGGSDFDFSRSIGLRVDTVRQAFELERMLHTVFKSSRLPVNEVEKLIDHGSGLSEWFHADCLERVQVFLAHIKDVVRFERVPLRLPEKASTAPAPCVVEKACKAQVAPDFDAENKQHLEAFNQALAEILELGEFKSISPDGPERFTALFAIEHPADWKRVYDLFFILLMRGQFFNCGNYGRYSLMRGIAHQDGEVEISINSAIEYSVGVSSGGTFELHFASALDLFRSPPIVEVGHYDYGKGAGEPRFSSLKDAVIYSARQSVESAGWQVTQK
jgi:hypothetical protein